jgi:hypothetical protein
MIELDITAAEAIGRKIVKDGELPTYRKTFMLSITRTAQILGTSTKVVRQWEQNPRMTTRMHSMSAARLGQLTNQLDGLTLDLHQENLEPHDLVPLWYLASGLGISPNSPRLAQKCQAEEITCFDLGILGTYILRAQADALLQTKGIM